MKLLSFLICITVLLGFSNLIQAQTEPEPGVGINTTNPRTTLEVAGDAYVTGNVLVQTIDEITEDEEATFLIQNESDFVKEINATEGGLAIAYFQEYTLSNMEDGVGDWVEDFNTNIPSSKYMVTVISGFYNQPLMMWGDKISNFTIPYISAYIKAGTWWIIADYPDALNITNTEEGVWVINTLILTKSFSKILPTQTFNMSNSASGSSPSPVID